MSGKAIGGVVHAGFQARGEVRRPAYAATQGFEGPRFSMHRGTYAEIELLVVVKAYPNLSQRYGEVVCVAGIRTDTDPHEWVRLYPVPFRALPYHCQFHTYEYIRVRVQQHAGDSHPERLRPNVDSITLGERLDPKDAWRARRQVVEPLALPSVCELARLRERDGTSLGIFRPAEIAGLKITAFERHSD